METKVSHQVEATKLQEYIVIAKATLEAKMDGLSSRSNALLKLLDSIPKSDDKTRVLEYILVNYGDTESSGIELKGNKLSDEEWEMFSENHLEYIIAVFNRLTLARPNSFELAKGIDKLIAEFQSHSEKTFVLSIILSRDLIPYVQIPQGGQYVSNARFEVLTKELKDKIKLLRAIQNSRLKNRSQMASLMLGVVNSAKDDEEKAVTMTVALALEYQRGKKEGGEK